LTESIPRLGQALSLCLFLFFIFGLVGVELWGGSFHQQCVYQNDPNTASLVDAFQFEYESARKCPLGDDVSTVPLLPTPT
jgi:hypothetical protein